MEKEQKPKKSKLKRVLMIVIPIILILSISIGYMVIAQKSISDIKKVFERPEGEFTMALEEFLVNVQSTTGKNRYLKIKLALMYTDNKQGEFLTANVSRIRDIIIADLRVRETEEILDPEAAEGIKKKIREDINIGLGNDIVKEVYITDLIVQ